MKNSFYIIILCLICSVSYAQNNAKAKLPFGSSILMRYKFSGKWTHPPFSADFKPSSLDEKQLIKLQDYYNSLNGIKKKSLMPPVKKIEYIQIGTDSIITSKSQFKSNFQYQLPDFGPYHCYYKFNQLGDNIVMRNRNVRTTGELILYDYKSKEAKVLVIYQSYDYGGIDVYTRYFLIDTNKKVTLYTVDQDETDVTFKRDHEIVILNDGKIHIKNI